MIYQPPWRFNAYCLRNDMEIRNLTRQSIRTLRDKAVQRR
jgi:hypothetical protein